MKQEIPKYIECCEKCQQFNIDQQKSLGFFNPIEHPTGPFQLVGIDYTDPFRVTSLGNKYILAIIGYLKKWVIAIPVSNRTAQTTAAALYQFVIPKRILSDQGVHFCNHLMVTNTHVCWLSSHQINSI
ncbi:unnamed protein product [Rotaria magnacalcarata]|uniref:Integrase catalytic domain-containing protein n=1 Tax=Rotaria magnacalcarata TaxID=392030 RepID=A0A814P7X0_9BILA|nr:unnamed protein product [Rotaria magnacalcarata]CAF1624131.1 unnamed protein product [Rotaria magnacalcarata]CAF2053846.1 unnamed protein product [Rotaria magnacalcarata]CAF3923770.1 unnamed protein product [Rotaria magnacalcarata]CAF3963371.1 unnamed protein product [Rotaria magnacalcarata]